MMSDPGLYSYTPLKDASAQIRILRIDFDANAAGGHKSRRPLAGSMRNYYLPKSTLSRTQRVIRSVQIPAFYALSYVWGDPTRTHEILVDGKTLKITENLYNALRDMQRDSIIDPYVWADAVCINQEDLDERSAQVLLMREVYHSAAFVQIWLGPSTAEGKRCLKFVSDLTGHYYDDKTPDEETEEKIPKAIYVTAGAVLKVGQKFAHGLFEFVDIAEPEARDDRATLILDSDGDQKVVTQFTKWRPSTRRLKKVENENFAEIAALFDLTFIQHCSWFERMWVVQELGVAFLPDIIYDGVSISWDDFLLTAYYLHYTCKLPLPSIQKLTGLEKIRMGWTDSKRLSLYDLIRECQYREATDPRDRVYALLGLMGDRMNNFLRPDYTKSVGEVYALTTQHFIWQSGSLDPICGWQTYNRQDLPSWIPDYALDQSRGASPLVLNYGRTSLFSASGFDHRAKYQISNSPLQDWGCLCVTGLCLGSIAVLSDPAPDDAQFGAIEQLWHSVIIGSKHLFQRSIKDFDALLSSVSSVVSQYSNYWENAGSTRSFSSRSYSKDGTTLADMIAQHPGLQVNSVNNGNQVIVDMYIQSLLCGRGTTRTRLTDRDIKTIMNLKLPEAPEGSENESIGLICMALESGMKNRLMGVTSKGSVCVLPEQARQGDFVYVLFGCSVPVVLRKLDDDKSYTFIGECYTHEFMDGQAIAMQVKGELSEQKLVLK
jgi:hypothetical protein